VGRISEVELRAERRKSLNPKTERPTVAKKPAKKSKKKSKSSGSKAGILINEK
jgi:hypothetical protein